MSRVLKKHLFHALLLALPLLFSGCFVSVHDDPYDPNTLVIENDFDALGDIWYAYVTPSSATSWGPELLGPDALQPGDELIVDIYDCNRYYDLRVEYDHGLVIEEYELWLPCRTTTIVPFRDW